MVTTHIGSIRNVPLREVWPNEAQDFTKWLAEPDNLNLFGNAIGIEFDADEAETEHPVGAFSLDVFAKDAEGRTIVIENQLEDTNHDHLGKLITYAAGTGAAVAVWVVKRARDEHRKAIEWLNGHTDRDVDFILVELSAIAIGDSLPAPLFTVVEAPNDWAKAVKQSENASEMDKLKLSYWQAFADAAANDQAFSARFKVKKPQTWNWMSFASGDGRFHYEASIAPSTSRICVSLYIRNNKEFGAKVSSHVAEFELALGCGATIIDGTKASGLRFYKSSCPISGQRDNWTSYFSWQRKSILKLAEVYDRLFL